ncbi:receptor-transporting protein 3-like [Acanthopagrus latus]|uniref:receptor-transporting protein 3-like n=1 Tax=Acanthopagrus latus TaxID=8177 RepID=UPI00187C0DA7|nr:receptor-transporting protein 3-like [Acanthopagrus latus]
MAIMNDYQWRSIFKTQVNNLNQGDSWHLQFDRKIVPHHPNLGWREYIGKTSARFRCTECRRRVWNSNHVTVVFHMHLESGQGTVKVKCLGQKCIICCDGSMETPVIDSQNIKILVENLMEEIRIQCYNENLNKVERLPQSLHITRRHEPSHCQACIEGTCG